MVDRSIRQRPGLALLVLLPALWSSSCDPISNDDNPPPRDVDIVQGAEDAGPNAFSPTNVVISLASQNTVTWFNADFAGGPYGGASGTAHHLQSDDGTTFDSGAVEAQGVFQATFTAPGTHSYHCEFHDGMTGTVTVNP